MKILVEKFCSIATDEPWLRWLYAYDSELYKTYIEELKIVAGCSGKRELVVRTLDKIDSNGDGYKLLEFINNNYPRIIIKDSKKTIKNDIFPDYKPSILSYPRRIILKPHELDNFISDKFMYDSITIDDVTYIEFLLDSDRHLVDTIPIDNWLIKKFRNNQR